jgi:hypothetical protein
MAGDAGKLSELHSLAFDYASGFVHPSAIFLVSQMSEPVPGAVLHIGTRRQDDEAEKALRIAHDLALSAVDLRLKYSRSDELRARLEACTKDFVKIWGYVPHF